LTFFTHIINYRGEVCVVVVVLVVVVVVVVVVVFEYVKDAVILISFLN